MIEVSRGCPFFCEFCDIRVLPDNNRANNKPIDVILWDIDRLARLGVERFLLGCDNFIGDPRWAEDLVDRLIAWKRQTGHRVVFHTWMTINLHRMPRLMTKMRHAGFDTIFIGVESFNHNSLLETAKLQNTTQELTQALRLIQSYGFLVIAGLIFGFDADGPQSFDLTLQSVLAAGLLSGDPSLLNAYPGTPLYQRMQDEGRLRDTSYGPGGFKYRTNIRYVMPKQMIVRSYIRFIHRFAAGRYQFMRLKVFMDGLRQGNYIPLDGGGYFNVIDALKMVARSRSAVVQMMRRLLGFAVRPSNWYWLVRALVMVTPRTDIANRFQYLRLWFVLWTNLIVRYGRISPADFDIDDCGSDEGGGDTPYTGMTSGTALSSADKTTRLRPRALARYRA